MQEALIKARTKPEKRQPLGLPFFFSLDGRFVEMEAFASHEIEGDAIDAIPEARGGRAIFKDVAKVSSTSPTNHLHAPHTMAEIKGSGHRCAVRRLEKTWPSAVALEFGSRIE